MAFRIASRPTEPTRKGKPKKDADYLSAIHLLPCCVTGQSGVEAAHVSFAAPFYGAYGRGKGQKVSDRWTLPVCADEHKRQHGMNEQEYWAGVGIDPHLLALRIHGLWTEFGDDFVPFATAMIMAGIVDRTDRTPKARW